MQVCASAAEWALDNLHKRFIAESITRYCPPHSTGRSRLIHGEIVALFIGQTRIDLDEAEKAELAHECPGLVSSLQWKQGSHTFQIGV